MVELSTTDVEEALRRLGLEIEVQSFAESTGTAPEAAAAIGTELGAIVKSLCFMVDGQPILILTAGDRRVDDRKVSALYDVSRKKVKIADYDATVAVTGYAPGGVPPVGHAQPLRVLIDSSLGRYETVYAAAGSSNTIFPIPFNTLVEITAGRVEDIVKE